MQYQSILFEITDGVATLTLNRPDRLNAFTEAMHVEIRHAIGQVEQPGAARVLVITGHSTESAAIEALNFGVTGYLVKPVRASEVVAAAARVLA